MKEEQKKQFQEMDKIELSVELEHACLKGLLEVVKYLLTSSELKEHADIHYDYDQSFFNAYNEDRVDVVQYLVFDYKINKTKDIIKNLVQHSRTDISNLFYKRDLEEKLQNTLTNNKKIDNKIKL